MFFDPTALYVMHLKLRIKVPAKVRKGFIFLALALLTGRFELAQEHSAWRNPSKQQFVTVEDGVRLEVLDWRFWQALSATSRRGRHGARI